jgi:hypothetical protein
MYLCRLIRRNAFFRPGSAIQDIPDALHANIESLSQLSLCPTTSLVETSDLLSRFLRELPLATSQADAVCVHLVFSAGHVFQIAESVILLVAIFVIDVHARWPRPQKSERNQAVNHPTI